MDLMPHLALLSPPQETSSMLSTESLFFEKGGETFFTDDLGASYRVCFDPEMGFR
jgi:hypothetical protein